MDGKEFKPFKKPHKPTLESPYKGNMLSMGNIKNDVSLDRYSHISEEEKRGNNFKRKSSTPEKIRSRQNHYLFSASNGNRSTRRIINSRKKQLINLFEKNIVDELIDSNALLVGGIDDLAPLFHEITDQNEACGGGLQTINDYVEEADSTERGSKYKNFRTNPRNHESTSMIPMDLITSLHENDNEDERETGAQTSSEEDDELCISMFLKNDPKLTVN